MTQFIPAHGSENMELDPIKLETMTSACKFVMVCQYATIVRQCKYPANGRRGYCTCTLSGHITK
jgi:hypothetical protein